MKLISRSDRRMDSLTERGTASRGVLLKSNELIALDQREPRGGAAQEEKRVRKKQRPPSGLILRSKDNATALKGV